MNFLKTIKQVDSLGKILPMCMLLVTKEGRYRPEIRWSSSSWTHNIFRAYELFFWRRNGIRPEATYAPTFVEFHSWESVFAYCETQIRTLRLPKIQKVYLPQLSLAGGYGSGRSPYVFAIALDVANTGATSATSPVTYSHTITGSNPFLFAGGSLLSSNGTTATFGATTYNTVAMTSVREDTNTSAFASRSGVFFLGNPATGAHTVSMAFSGGFAPGLGVGSTSYSGAQSASSADAVNGANSNSTTGSQSFNVTTVANNCWVVCVLCCQGGNANTALQTQRWNASISLPSGSYCGEDTNGPKTPAGAQSMGWTINISNINGWAMSGASFAPAAVVGASAHNLSVVGAGS